MTADLARKRAQSTEFPVSSSADCPELGDQLWFDDMFGLVLPDLRKPEAAAAMAQANK